MKRWRGLHILCQTVRKDIVYKVTVQRLRKMREQPIGCLGEEHSRHRSGTCSSGAGKSQEASLAGEE